LKEVNVLKIRLQLLLPVLAALAAAFLNGEGAWGP
jgi:hypothetical protein